MSRKIKRSADHEEEVVFVERSRSDVVIRGERRKL
jgi:hypothetical protein